MKFHRVAEEQGNVFKSLSSELSCNSLGGRILSCSDEWFADASNLIKPGPAEFLKGQFGPKGALYDGWETRRHNPTYDWVILRLGPNGGGYISGFDVDTTTFNGNEAPAVAIYGANIKDDSIDAEDPRWEVIMEKAPCDPASHHWFLLQDAKVSTSSYTHIKLHMIPDGGISRFRVFGVVVPPPVGDGVSETAVAGRPELNVLDLAHALNGGRVVL